MKRFLENALELFDAAERSSASGQELSETTILISPAGGIQIVADSDWPLESLQAHRGAGMAYRISHQGKTVRLEGRAGSRTCLFETAQPDGAARLPNTEGAASLLRPTMLSPGLPAAASARLLPA